MTNLVIVDYEVGNISSLKNALVKIGVKHHVSDNIKKIEKADIVILPGVGSFDKAMSMLKKKKLIKILKNLKAQERRIIGICVGMQVLASKGYENKITTGLDFISGEIKKIKKSKNQRLPIMNWHEIYSRKNDKIKINKKNFYFLHSYYFSLREKENLLYYYYSHNCEIPAIIKKDNVYGIQFHPEKSGENGLYLLEQLINYKI